MTFDPYVELDVPRDADTPTIRKAYRRKAKRAHPDAGGSAAEFDRARRAMTVLSDPAKRSKYDSTGAFDDEPDNARSTALQIIDGLISQQINEFLNARQAFGVRPTPAVTWNTNILDAVRAKLLTDCKVAERSVDETKDAVRVLEGLKRRLSTTDPQKPIERGFDQRIAHAQAHAAQLSANIEARKLALTILDTYKFEML
jgi:curved DNA-binding protein CbpA